jgi:hypothetical protein
MTGVLLRARLSTKAAARAGAAFSIMACTPELKRTDRHRPDSTAQAADELEQ